MMSWRDVVGHQAATTTTTQVRSQHRPEQRSPNEENDTRTAVPHHVQDGTENDKFAAAMKDDTLTARERDQLRYFRLATRKKERSEQEQQLVEFRHEQMTKRWAKGQEDLKPSRVLYISDFLSNGREVRKAAASPRDASPKGILTRPQPSAHTAEAIASRPVLEKHAPVELSNKTAVHCVMRGSAVNALLEQEEQQRQRQVPAAAQQQTTLLPAKKKKTPKASDSSSDAKITKDLTVISIPGTTTAIGKASDGTHRQSHNATTVGAHVKDNAALRSSKPSKPTPLKKQIYSVREKFYRELVASWESQDRALEEHAQVVGLDATDAAERSNHHSEDDEPVADDTIAAHSYIDPSAAVVSDCRGIGSGQEELNAALQTIGRKAAELEGLYALLHEDMKQLHRDGHAKILGHRDSNDEERARKVRLAMRTLHRKKMQLRRFVLNWKFEPSNTPKHSPSVKEPNNVEDDASSSEGECDAETKRISSVLAAHMFAAAAAPLENSALPHDNDAVTTVKRRGNFFPELIPLLRLAMSLPLGDGGGPLARALHPLAESIDLRHARGAPSMLREYCVNVLTDALDSSATQFLQKLNAAQKKLKQTQPLHFKSRMRYVCGLREVMRGVLARRVRVVLIAPDIEPTSPTVTQDWTREVRSVAELTAAELSTLENTLKSSVKVLGLDGAVRSIVEACALKGICWVTCLSRRQMAQALRMKESNVSVVAVFSADGAYDEYRALIDEAKRQALAYQQLLNTTLPQ